MPRPRRPPRIFCPSQGHLVSTDAGNGASSGCARGAVRHADAAHASRSQVVRARRTAAVARRILSALVTGRWLAWVGAIVVVLLVSVCGYLAMRLTDDQVVSGEDNAIEHFKYGSTGGERGYHLQFGFGVPYWIWVALPEVF